MTNEILYKANWDLFGIGAVGTVIDYPKVHTTGAIGLLPSRCTKTIEVRVKIDCKDRLSSMPMNLRSSDFDCELFLSSLAGKTWIRFHFRTHFTVADYFL